MLPGAFAEISRLLREEDAAVCKREPDRHDELQGESESAHGRFCCVHVALARSSEEASRLLCRLYGLHNKRQTVVNLKNRLKAVGVQIDVAAVEPLSPQEAVRQWRCVGRLKSV